MIPEKFTVTKEYKHESYCLILDCIVVIKKHLHKSPIIVDRKLDKFYRRFDMQRFTLDIGDDSNFYLEVNIKEQKLTICIKIALRGISQRIACVIELPVTQMIHYIGDANEIVFEEIERAEKNLNNLLVCDTE